MRAFERKLIFMATRWLAKRRWGRRLIWAYALRSMRARIRSFLQELAALFPLLQPLATWV